MELHCKESNEIKQTTKLKFEKQQRCYNDFHPQILKAADNTLLKAKGFHHKQHAERKVRESEELVKYMSKLPSFLESGGTIEEKAFNVGVLDWRLLKKWQHNHKESTHRKGYHSPSSSNTSSFFSTEGSSSLSSTDGNCSPAQQRIRHPTLQSHLNTPATGGDHVVATPSICKTGKFEECNYATVNSLKVQQNLFNANKSSSEDTDNKLEEFKTRDTDPQRVSKMRRFRNPENRRIPSSSKGKMKIRHGERHETAPEPNDGPEIKCSASSGRSESATGGRRMLKETDRGEFSEGSTILSYPGVTSDSYHCACETDSAEDSELLGSHTKQVTGVTSTSGLKQKVTLPDNISSSPSICNSLEESRNRLIPVSTSLTDRKSSDGSNLNIDISEAAKFRSPSPIHHFCFSNGRTIRSSGGKEYSGITNPSSKQQTDNSSLEMSYTSACSGNSTSDRSNAARKSRSSPLRRLLDPLLKSKSADIDHFASSSGKDSLTTDRRSVSSSRRGEPPSLRPVGVKLDLKSSKTIDSGEPHQSKKNRLETVQALLQIAVKNGLPLFTFAVDNSSEILAATVKKSSSGKSGSSWIYTFFSVHEIKKKNRHWIYQGGNDKNHGYVPDAVAQMRVSDVLGIKQRSLSKSTLREFILFSTRTREADQQSSELLPSDELAAIVVKFPGKQDRQCNQGAQQSVAFNKSSAVGFREQFQEARCCSDPNDDEHNVSFATSEDPFTVTAILPGGDHGMPTDGKPSPLLKRWKSGGSCDCGGWDVGCRLRLFTNFQLNGKSNLTKAPGRFELFSQGEVPESKPVFSLSPFKDGIFSVEFSSSFKLLQAFAIGIAVLKGEKPILPLEMGSMDKSKTSEEILLEESNAVKFKHQAQVEVSANYKSYPPLSPVGRV